MLMKSQNQPSRNGRQNTRTIKAFSPDIRERGQEKRCRNDQLAVA